MKEETLEKESGITLDKWLLNNFCLQYLHPYSLTPQWEGQHGEFALVRVVLILLQLGLLGCRAVPTLFYLLNFMTLDLPFLCRLFLVPSSCCYFCPPKRKEKIPKQIVLHCEQP